MLAFNESDSLHDKEIPLEFSGPISQNLEALFDSLDDGIPNNSLMNEEILTGNEDGHSGQAYSGNDDNNIENVAELIQNLIDDLTPEDNGELYKCKFLILKFISLLDIDDYGNTIQQAILPLPLNPPNNHNRGNHHNAARKYKIDDFSDIYIYMR